VQIVTAQDVRLRDQVVQVYTDPLVQPGALLQNDVERKLLLLNLVSKSMCRFRKAGLLFSHKLNKAGRLASQKLNKECKGSLHEKITSCFGFSGAWDLLCSNYA
jgi:hypothetical protein